MPFYVVKKDILNMNTDAIVNSANQYPTVLEGVESQIYNKAGIELLKRREQIGEISVSESRLSKAYNLNNSFVIHTVSPVYSDSPKFDQQLIKAYKSALQLALESNIKSIAFPLLASGTNGCPEEKALNIAVKTITDFIYSNDIEVYLVLYKPLKTALSVEIRDYIYNYHLNTSRKIQSQNRFNRVMNNDEIFAHKKAKSVEDFTKEIEKSFHQKLFGFIDLYSLNEVDVYKKANISRKLFSKIRSDKTYLPHKRTVIALSIALELDLEETRELLKSAGYYLTRSIEFDLIVIFFIERQIYNIYDINLVLFEYGYNVLGSK